MCTRRNFLLFVCSLQLLTIIARQVIDFLGYMWAPILANFLHMIFIIFGFFGAYQFRSKYLVSYSVWNVLWLGWNAFLICFYFNVGILDRDSDILNFGTGSVSWFESNGYGCKPIFKTNTTIEDPFKIIRPDQVDGCLLDYPIVEVAFSSVQIFLTLLGLIGALCIGCALWDDDDSFEFMGSDIKSPQHTSVRPMFVSYSSIPTHGSASSTQINSKKDPNNQFGAVLTSLNNSNTNSLSSTYIKNHNYPSNINSPAKIHHPNQMQSPTHYKLIDQRQLSNSNLSQYNSRNNLINKSASTQQIIKRNPSFTTPSTNRSDIRYTEIIAATDDILNRCEDDRDVDTNSIRSYGRPSSQASTAACSPIISSKLMATNLQQQQLVSKSFGIHNPLNNLIHNDDINDGRVGSKHSIDFEFNNQGQLVAKSQPKLYSANNPPMPPPHRPDYNAHKYAPANPTSKPYQHSPPHIQNQSNLHHNHPSLHQNPAFSHQSPPHIPPHHHQISSPQDKQPPHQQFVARSPNLNHMPRRRQSQQQAYQQTPLPHPLETSHSNNNSINSRLNAPFCDQLREQPLPARYNLNQFIPEYHCPNPLPAIPPHMMQHPMYRVRSQDRISNRLKRQSGAHQYAASPHESQRPRSFCNNMINYQDYKDIQ